MKDPENFKASDYKEVPHWSELKNKWLIIKKMVEKTNPVEEK